MRWRSALEKYQLGKASVRWRQICFSSGDKWRGTTTRPRERSTSSSGPKPKSNEIKRLEGNPGRRELDFGFGPRFPISVPSCEQDRRSILAIAPKPAQLFLEPPAWPSGRTAQGLDPTPGGDTICGGWRTTHAHMMCLQRGSVACGECVVRGPAMGVRWQGGADQWATHRHRLCRAIHVPLPRPWPHRGTACRVFAGHRSRTRQRRRGGAPRGHTQASAGAVHPRSRSRHIGRRCIRCVRGSPSPCSAIVRCRTMGERWRYGCALCECGSLCDPPLQSFPHRKFSAAAWA